MPGPEATFTSSTRGFVSRSPSMNSFTRTTNPTPAEMGLVPRSALLLDEHAASLIPLKYASRWVITEPVLVAFAWLADLWCLRLLFGCSTACQEYRDVLFLKQHRESSLSPIRKTLAPALLTNKLAYAQHVTPTKTSSKRRELSHRAIFGSV